MFGTTLGLAVGTFFGWAIVRALADQGIDTLTVPVSSLAALPEPVVVVLEGTARRGVEEGVADGVTVVHAPGDGDDTLASLAATADAPVVLVSADRELRARIRSSGAGGRGTELAARPPRSLLSNAPGGSVPVR